MHKCINLIAVNFIMTSDHWLRHNSSITVTSTSNTLKYISTRKLETLGLLNTSLQSSLENRRTYVTWTLVIESKVINPRLGSERVLSFYLFGEPHGTQRQCLNSFKATSTLTGLEGSEKTFRSLSVAPCSEHKTTLESHTTPLLLFTSPFQHLMSSLCPHP